MQAIREAIPHWQTPAKLYIFLGQRGPAALNAVAALIPEYNLVPRALFPGFASKTRKKRPGEEVAPNRPYKGVPPPPYNTCAGLSECKVITCQNLST